MSIQRPVKCSSLSPHVRRLFELINASHMDLEAVAEQIPLNKDTLLKWGRGRMPQIHNLEAAFNVFGRTLVDIDIQEL